MDQKPTKLHIVPDVDPHTEAFEKEAKRVLEEKDYTDLVMIGVDAAGELFVIASSGDRFATGGMLAVGQQLVTESIIHGDS